MIITHAPYAYAHGDLLANKTSRHEQVILKIAFGSALWQLHNEIIQEMYCSATRGVKGKSSTSLMYSTPCMLLTSSVVGSADAGKHVSWYVVRRVGIVKLFCAVSTKGMEHEERVENGEYWPTYPT